MLPYLFTRKMQSTPNSQGHSTYIRHSTMLCTTYKTAFLACIMTCILSLPPVCLLSVSCAQPCGNIFIWALIHMLKNRLGSKQKEKKRQFSSFPSHLKKRKLNSNPSKSEGMKFYWKISWRLIFSKVFMYLKIRTSIYVGFFNSFTINVLMKVNHLHLLPPEYFWKTVPYYINCLINVHSYTLFSQLIRTNLS